MQAVIERVSRAFHIDFRFCIKYKKKTEANAAPIICGAIELLTWKEAIMKIENKIKYLERLFLKKRSNMIAKPKRNGIAGITPFSVNMLQADLLKAIPAIT